MAIPIVLPAAGTAAATALEGLAVGAGALGLTALATWAKENSSKLQGITTNISRSLGNAMRMSNEAINAPMYATIQAPGYERRERVLQAAEEKKNEETNNAPESTSTNTEESTSSTETTASPTPEPKNDKEDNKKPTESDRKEGVLRRSVKYVAKHPVKTAAVVTGTTMAATSKPMRYYVWPTIGNAAIWANNAGWADPGEESEYISYGPPEKKETTPPMKMEEQGDTAIIKSDNTSKPTRSLKPKIAK